MQIQNRRLNIIKQKTNKKLKSVVEYNGQPYTIYLITIFEYNYYVNICLKIKFLRKQKFT